MINKNTAIKIVQQLEKFVKTGYRIAIDNFRTFEITVFERNGLEHHHYAGETLAEAVNRAYRETFMPNEN